MNNFLALFVLLPVFGAVMSLFLGEPSRTRRVVALFTQGLLAALSLFLLREVSLAGPLTLAVGNWIAPYGITLGVDTLGALFLTTAHVVTFLVLLQELLVRSHHAEPRMLLPLVHFLSLGAGFAFLTGDFFNLFVAFEILLVASYGLLSLEPSNGRVREAYPYLLLNIVGSAVFLLTAGFVYASWGTLNFADLAHQLAQDPADPRRRVFGVLAFFVFALKAGLVPLHLWLPRAYPSLRPTLAALFSALLTKVGVYVLLRLHLSVADFASLGLDQLLLWAGLATLILGGLGALARTSVRGILAFHIVSQIGYMMVGLGLGSGLAVTGVVLFALHNMIVKPGLFCVGGIVEHSYGSDELAETGGFYRFAPLTSGLFLLLAFALSGFPPLSGFWAKYVLASSSVLLAQPAVLLVLLSGGLLTLLSMLKIWSQTFAGVGPAELRFRSQKRTLVAPALLAALSLLLGLGLGDFTGLAETAVEQAANRDELRIRFESVGEKGR